MQEIRCEKCGRIIATIEGDELTILCPHAGKREENGYIYGKCKTENKIKMNTKKESVEDENIVRTCRSRKDDVPRK